MKGNVQSAWNQGYRGQNTVVAVIDSGADPSHKDFQTMPSDPKLKKDDVQKKIDQQGYGKYVNEKFPYVYNYADRDNDYITSDDTNPMIVLTVNTYQELLQQMGILMEITSM